MFDYKAELIRIIDGDTFVATIDLGFSTHRKETVRLAGINTPESRTRNLEEKKHGLAAKKKLGDLLTNAKEIIIVVKEVGKYGRALGVVTVDGTNVNYELIDTGYAYPYSGEQKLNYEQMLQRYPAMEEVRKKLG
jgi:micrococcal nuclease|tara:strand:- start:246 stop:650 length:405 start_codon:yes stop_codon:yes gene_type:complete